MPDTNDVLLVASYDSLGNTSDIPPTTVYTAPNSGFYSCALNFKWTETSGTNYEVIVPNFALLNTNGGPSGNLSVLGTSYLTAGTVVTVHSDSGGNPPPTINFDVHLRIVQIG